MEPDDFDAERELLEKEYQALKATGDRLHPEDLVGHNTHRMKLIEHNRKALERVERLRSAARNRFKIEDL
jgi:hypothetical protein